MTCKECALWNIEAAKDKAGRVRSDRAVLCLWISREQYPFSIHPLEKRPRAGFTTAKDGHRCPQFRKREVGR